MKQSERKKLFIERLAEFLVDNQAGKGISLQVELERGDGGRMPRWGSEWARLRNATPLFGYPTVEEAIEQLTEFLA